MMEQQELKQLISDRTHEITYACRTFLLVSQEHKQLIDDELRTGGGHILMAIGLFAALEYLGNIYSVLSMGEKENRGKDGRLIANKTFSYLLLKCPTKLGLDQLKDKKKFWKDWRNGLAHLLVQKHGKVEVKIYTQSYQEVVSALDAKPDVFEYREKKYICDIHKMAAQLDVIANWIVTQCDAKGAHTNEALAWIKESADRRRTIRSG